METCRGYRDWAEEQVELARKWGQTVGARAQVEAWAPEDREHLAGRLDQMAAHWWDKLDARCKKILDGWDGLAERYRQDAFTYTVRGREIAASLFRETLSGTRLPRVALPRTEDPGERLRFALLENLPGYFPFTAGVFPFKREGEDPARMFAGEGGPERTNRRFHLVSLGLPAQRLSTAFDSVTLYGFDPDRRPDIYGKVGNAGVSIPTLDDMKKLFSGFNLCSQRTSVSMTINGPAPTILAMFMNAAVDQQVEFFLKEENRWDEADKVINEKLGDGRPAYVPYGPSGVMDGLPEGHDGSGLGLLGCTGSDLVDWGLLEKDEYERIQADGAQGRARHRPGGYLERRPGAEHLHLLHRVRPACDGGRPAGVYRPGRAELLLGLHQRLPHRRSGREPDHPTRPHARQRVHLRRVLSQPGDGH